MSADHLHLSLSLYSLCLCKYTTSKAIKEMNILREGHNINPSICNTRSFKLFKTIIFIIEKIKQAWKAFCNDLQNENVSRRRSSENTHLNDMSLVAIPRWTKEHPLNRRALLWTTRPPWWSSQKPSPSLHRKWWVSPLWECPLSVCFQ